VPCCLGSRSQIMRHYRVHNIRRDGPDGVGRAVRFTSIVMCQSGSSISSSGWKALNASIGEQDVDAAEFLFAPEGGRSQRGRSRWSSLMPSQRRPAVRTSRPVSSKSSGVDGSTPERGLLAHRYRDR